MLPSVMTKNTMFRAPWVKGLLGVFDFRKFIEVNDGSPTIKDIYGKEYNIFDDDIRIIFTKSQFKMYKFYDSWDEYKDNFKNIIVKLVDVILKKIELKMQKLTIKCCRH